MWQSGAILELLMCHTDYPNADSTIMKSVVDSPAWVPWNLTLTLRLVRRNEIFGLAWRWMA
jgi:hypothetical protein